MKSTEIGTTLKHLETINGNVKNLSKRLKRKDKGNINFYIFLPLIASVFGRTLKEKIILHVGGV